MKLRAVLAAVTLACGVGAAQARCGLPEGVDATPFKPQNVGREEIGRDLDAIVEQGFIEIGVYEDFPPYSWVEGGKPRGVDVALAELVAAELGVEARVRAVAAGENVDADLRNWIATGPAVGGRIVNVMMRVPWHPDFACRNELAVISGQYHTERVGVAWRETAFGDGAPSLDTLAIAGVAVENDSLADFYLSRHSGGAALPAMRRFATMAEAMDALAAGDVDAAMGPLAQLQWGAREVEGVRVAAPDMPGLSLGTWTVGVAVRHNVRQLGYAVADAVLAAIEDGRLEAIYAAHGLDWSPPDW